MMKKNNKAWTAVLSILIAVGLWFYVVTVVKPESTNTYYNIPVVLEGESFLTERGLMLVGGKDTTITMELYGNRTDLDKVNSGNITLIADLSRIDNAGEVELSYSHRFPGDVPSGALTVQSQSPNTIKLTVANRVSKNVPVQVNWTGTAPDPSMYIVDKENYVLDNPTIQVTGPDTVIDLIDHASIEVDLTDKVESFSDSYNITLCDKEGNGVNAEAVKVSAADVRMELKIQYFKNIRLDVDDIPGGGATRATSSIVYDPGTIQVSGNRKVLDKMTKLVIGTVNLGELTEATELTFPIELDEGLTNLTGVTEAKVRISFPNLETKELSITKIQALNVPEGMSYELVTQTLKVTVRGPKDVVKRVLAGDVTVTIDFANAAPGTATFKPVITVDTTKHPGVGAIGNYSISATLLDEAAAASETP